MSIHAFVKLLSYKNLFFRVILVKKAQARILKKKISNFQICQNQFLYWKTQPIGTWKLQYVLAGFGIWGARLCTCLKHWRLAKKSTPCLIKRASTCAADCMSKTAKFFIFPFLSSTKILQENHVYLFIILLVQWWKWHYQKQPPEAFYERRCS